MADILARVAIIGEENVGKSSLLNSLVGEHTSIVTPLAGTTRDQIRGYVLDGEAAFEVSDTPGMHKNSTILGRHMRKSISNAVAEADVILYVLDAERFGPADVIKIENYKNQGKPVIAAVNKIDKVTPERLFSQLALLNKLDFVAAVVPISVKAGTNLDILRKELAKCKDTEKGPKGAVPDEVFTDQSMRKMAQEIIRAAVITNTRAEIPHGVTVMIREFTEKTDLVEIHADIICEKQSHKPIIIGKKGAVLKQIGIEARAQIEKLTGVHARIELYVLVRENWKNNKEFFDQA